MAGSSSDLTVVSLFSGAGGLDLAACQTGRVGRLFSTDSNATFLQTVIDNIPEHFPDVDHRYVVADARDLNADAICATLGTSKVDLVIGGPPCDDFTSYGRKKGLAGDKASLVFEYARLIQEIKPAAFLFENVPFLQLMFGDVFESLEKKIAKIGYRRESAILEASAYGAPTMRQRLFIVGFQDSELSKTFLFPSATHGNCGMGSTNEAGGSELSAYVTVADVLSDLPDVVDANPARYFNHVGRNHRPSTIEHIRTVPQGVAVKKSYRYRAPWEGLCRSLTAGTDTAAKAYIHPNFHREMTVRECARIHGFPDSWRFCGNLSQGIKQVANSVPISLGRSVLESVLERREVVLRG